MSDIPPEKPLEQKPEAEKEKRQAPDPKPNGPSADFAALIHTIKTEGRAYRREEQREDRGKKIREWVTIVLIALTFGAVCWQVYEMIHVYQPIKDQADAAALAADATVRAADAATKQSEIATQQAQKSDEALVRAQRAWVGPRDAKFKDNKAPTRDEETSFVLDYQNTGREPAVNVIWDVGHTTTSDEAAGAGKVTAFIDACKALWRPDQGQVVYPNTGFGGSSYSLLHKVPAGEITDGLVNGTESMLFYGCFSYETFGTIHRSWFCYFYTKGFSSPEHLNICVAANGAD